MKIVELKLEKKKKTARGHPPANTRGWTSFIVKLEIGDAFEIFIPTEKLKNKRYIDSRRSNIQYIAKRAGIRLTTWRTLTGLWAKRIA